MATNLSSSYFKKTLKSIIIVFIIITIFIISALLVFPKFLSSDMARGKIETYLSKDLNNRPVSVENISFSWTDGLAISGFKIDNQDQSRLLKLDNFKIVISWGKLLFRKIVVKTLKIDGIDLVLTRDESGKINIADLLEPTGKEPSKKEEKKKTEFSPDDIPALFLDAHIKNAYLTFIDKRLKTVTSIQKLTTDLSVRSLTEPLELFLKGEITVNDKDPELIELVGTANLVSAGKFDPGKALGNIKMKSGFGNLDAVFDLSKFHKADAETGLKLDCFLDLFKLSQLGAGIVGLPPGFTLKGNLQSGLEARGNIESNIDVIGKTTLKDLSMSGGPFKDKPFVQPAINLYQDLVLNFKADSVNIKNFDFKSEFMNLFLTGTIEKFQNKPSCKLILSGNGNLQELSKIAGKVITLPEDFSLSGNTSLSLSLMGELSALNIKGTTRFKDLKIEAAALGKTHFRENIVTISPDILINVPENIIDIRSAETISKTLKADAKGTIDGNSNIDMKVSCYTQFSHLKEQLKTLLPTAFPDQGHLSSDIEVKGNLNKKLLIKGTHSLKDAKILVPSSAATKNFSSSDIPPLQFQINHDVIYNQEDDYLTVNKLLGTSDFLELEGMCDITQLSKKTHFKSSINLVADLPRTVKIFKHILPKEIKAEGKGKLSFSAEGQLKAPGKKIPVMSSWNGKGNISLDSVDYEGLGSIQDFHSEQFSLKNGVLDLALKSLLNEGPCNVQGTMDLSKTKPAFTVKAEGNAIQLSQDIKMLGYVIPLLITNNSGNLTGEGNFFIESAWQGMDWTTEISKTISGKGNLSLNNGTLRSQDVLSWILKILEEPETLSFEQIFTDFRLSDSRIYNDNIQVNGKDLKFGLQGWTSLEYSKTQKGNPIEYTVKGIYVDKLLGSDAKKILSLIGKEKTALPIIIAGTVQKPKVSIKRQAVENTLKGFFGIP